ncbi:hypothetical protein [Kribbella catacumbae]|uniref:hypothetical protein n=1 Tax=Kribbella catacumbae TaxID=460086 RepID=UPI000361CA78|nr:hypothetical protein [Kribbella catacumbae]
MSEDNVNLAENPHAGKGSSVLLDIGGDIGALVIDMPAELEGAEIELRPAGRTIFSSTGETGGAQDHEHHDEVGHGHGHGHGHASSLPHVAVVPRPSPEGGTVYSAVFFEVAEGNYELYVRPAGPVQLTVDITGGQVTDAVWPR